MDRIEAPELDVDSEEAKQFIESTEIEHGPVTIRLDELIHDIQEAHEELDNYKSSGLGLSQVLSEQAENAENEMERAIFEDLRDGVFALYLRLQRGDKELLGERSGKYSGFLKE